MCSFPSTTTPYPRNAIVIDSCRLSQAKRRISVLTVTEKKVITEDEFRNDLKRQNGAGDIRL